MKNEFQAAMTTSLFSAKSWDYTNCATIRPNDVHHPWQSAHGFSVSAALLAANQPLILHCREDEVFDLLAKLNDLLGRPEVLERAFSLLTGLKEATIQKIDRLIELEEQPIADNEVAEIVKTIEQFLGTEESSSQTMLSRLEEILTPNRPVDQKAGLQKMLARLEGMLAALAQVKEQGFHVVVDNRRRQPDRPALEARRHEAILSNGQPTEFKAGFLLPAKYHLTLWNYVIVRNDKGQSTMWN